jgi:hypothetical protein
MMAMEPKYLYVVENFFEVYSFISVLPIRLCISGIRSQDHFHYQKIRNAGHCTDFVRSDNYAYTVRDSPWIAEPGECRD